ncbi:unnamed protein product [Prorocentrum cordatum]|uniref:Uncharacterized protein n=1 Tax=Prorocentrum cordatum TaxID=2364126 RepID=A0ABN9TY83_9DINO|nr:unnamed protein product [Polarella glacialis]
MALQAEQVGEGAEQPVDSSKATNRAKLQEESEAVELTQDLGCGVAAEEGTAKDEGGRKRGKRRADQVDASVEAAAEAPGAEGQPAAGRSKKRRDPPAEQAAPAAPEAEAQAVVEELDAVAYRTRIQSPARRPGRSCPIPCRPSARRRSPRG